MYTVASELAKNHAKLSRIERVIVRKRFAGGIIVSKSGQKSGFVLAETISYHHSLNYCSFRLIFGAFESDCMCSDAVHFKCEIWSLIHFL